MKRAKANYCSVWARAIDNNESAARKVPAYNESTDSRLTRLAFGEYKLECFLERLCVQHSAPWLEFEGLEAGRLYLLNKHHWTPAVLNEVQRSDLLVLLHEELAALVLTTEEFQPVHDWGMHQSCYPDLLAPANPQK